MRFLSGVAEDGEGSAALPLTRRPSERLMSRRTSNLLAVAVVAGVMAMIAARMVFPSVSKAPVPAAAVQDRPEVYPSMSAAPVVTPTVAAEQIPGGVRRDYAVAMPELRGLPIDTPPGTSLELWVAWDDAYAEGPQIQKLVRSVTLVRFIEPATAQGPIVAVLSIPERSMRAVMYGDVYGSFSVALPSA